MRTEHQCSLNLKLLAKGPVTEADLDWPLSAEVKYIMDEGPAVRIGFKVHTTVSGDVLFEDRIWDPDFEPDHPIPRSLKLSIAASKRHSRDRIRMWAKILEMETADTFNYMKRYDILKNRLIQLSVKVCKGTNDIQYIIIVAHRVIEKNDTLWCIDENPVRADVHVDEITEDEMILLQGTWNQEEYENEIRM